MKAIDIFAGAGGFTTGATMAGVEVVWAANHWPAAVAAHSANHPGTTHVCQDLHQANWLEVPAHDILLASPCCQGHGRARGKDRPHHDASRSTAWAVISALEFHRPGLAIVENVPEFLKWGLYPSFQDAAERLGYSLSILVHNAKDSGVPQERLRLFILMTRSRKPITIKLDKMPEQNASSIVRWDAFRWQKIASKVKNTQVRVANGRAAHGDRFVMPYYGSGSGLTGRSLHRPIGTITTRARWGVVDGDRMRMLHPEEVKAAMSFPPSYRLPSNIKLANHLLGNAVCPLQAKAIIQALLAAA